MSMNISENLCRPEDVVFKEVKDWGLDKNNNMIKKLCSFVVNSFMRYKNRAGFEALDKDIKK